MTEAGVVREWAPAVSGALADRAIHTATEVARRLVPANVLTELEKQPLVLHLEEVDTVTGVAVLHGEMDRLEGGWADRAHEKAWSSPSSRSNGPPFPHPARSVASAAWRTRLGRSAATASDTSGWWPFSTTTSRRPWPSAPPKMLEKPYGLAFHTYDVISGLAGAATYLLQVKENTLAKNALKDTLTAFVAISGERDGVPNWFTPAQEMFPNTPIGELYPNGTFNCGLAHGIPGPLALLSLAASEGVLVPGQVEAISRLGHWIANRRSDDRWGPNWPMGVGPIDAAGSYPKGHPTHNAWCYGSPGVARSLWLAGNAVDDDSLREIAVEAMMAVRQRPWRDRAMGDSPGLCHGVSGLLQIVLRFGHQTGDPRFADFSAELTEYLLRMYDPALPYGFSSLAEGGKYSDRPGFLDGASGVALTLLSAAADQPPTWDRQLLLT
ncbi:lanthionine synthetase C family protein [Fodinicola feengrottensis]|uniref:lanthionine synthetase C family protein n=1 Tax=Fodinicola feengrottensis TaxID=435914 RepID=UPI0013D20468|nr:lanthionine synthetase C family protein [Fodinicola feengrottensis]